MALKRTFREALHFVRNPKKIFSAVWEELDALDQRIDDDVEVTGLATSVASGEGYTQNQLNIAFGDVGSGLIPESFVGVYTNENDGKKYLVTVSDGQWKGILFTAIS